LRGPQRIRYRPEKCTTAATRLPRCNQYYRARRRTWLARRILVLEVQHIATLQEEVGLLRAVDRLALHNRRRGKVRRRINTCICAAICLRALRFSWSRWARMPGSSSGMAAASAMDRVSTVAHDQSEHDNPTIRTRTRASM
jgi:hypothetical protein